MLGGGRLNTRVAALEDGGLRLADGSRVACDAVVVATEAPAAAALLATREGRVGPPPPKALRRGLSRRAATHWVEARVSRRLPNVAAAACTLGSREIHL